jgi:hypothetical protein
MFPNGFILREEPCTDPYARFCGQTEAAASSDPIKCRLYETASSHLEPMFRPLVGSKRGDEDESGQPKALAVA